MINIIMSALDERWDAELRTADRPKKEHVEVDISEVEPLELQHFMRKRNIPDTAQFCISNDWEYTCPRPILYYDKFVDKDGDEILNDAIVMFNKYATSAGLKALRKAGYKRKRFSPSSKDLKAFDDLYVMYTNKDYDALKKYFELYFN